MEAKTNVRYRAYQFSLDIIQFYQSLPSQRIFWVIADQVLRSGTSIGANLVEARSSSSRRDFIKFYEIALKSANETLYWLCLLRDSKLKGIDVEDVKKLLVEAEEITRILAKSLLTLKKKTS